MKLLPQTVLIIASCAFTALHGENAAAASGAPKLVRSAQELGEGSVSDYLGWSIAISGTRIVVGAPGNQQADTVGKGYALVFELDAEGRWFQAARLEDPDGQLGDNFGTAVALSGNYIAVGASYDDTAAGENAGSVEMFQRNSAGAWQPVRKLLHPSANAYDNFGAAVSLAGDRLIIGAPSADVPDGQADAGAVSVFERTVDGDWAHVAEVMKLGPETGDFFGRSVSLSGDRMLVGAPKDDGAVELLNQGSAAVFERGSSGRWTQVATFLDEDTVLGDCCFGSSVSIDGDRAAVGDSDTDSNGKVLIYEKQSSGLWVRVAKLAGGEAEQHQEHFGSGVSLDGDRIVVGAMYDQAATGEYAGSATVFERTGPGVWVRVAKLIGVDCEGCGAFGAAVSASGARIAVGAYSTEVDAQRFAGSAAVLSVTDSGFDFGDSPAPYPTLRSMDGAHHSPGRLWLGYGSPDRDADGQPDAAAGGDDNGVLDDEDALTLPAGALVLGDPNTIGVHVEGAPGVLDAWIDYNRDGDWNDAGERIADHLGVEIGTNTLQLPAPPSAAIKGKTFARLRLSSDGVDSPLGAARDGEVEDHQVSIGTPAVKIPAAKSVAEGSSIKVTVSLNTVLDKDVTVTYRTQDQTATAGQDYTAGSGTLTVPAGQTSVTVKLQTTADDVGEGDESFLLTLTSASAASIANASALITIIDDGD